MNEHTTNPRIIIDANYIRGTSKDGAPFRAICKQGGRIVPIDTLIYELCSTDDINQWRASMNKLKVGVDAIEVWEHTSPMYKVELKENRPYGDPLHCERTRRIREMIANNPQYQPADMKKKDEAPEALEQELYDLCCAWLYNTDAGLLHRTGVELEGIADGYENTFWPQLQEAEPCGFKQIDVACDVPLLENT